MALRNVSKVFGAVVCVLAWAATARADSNLEDVLSDTGLKYSRGEEGVINVPCKLADGGSRMVFIRSRVESGDDGSFRRIYSQIHSSSRPYSEEEQQAMFTVCKRFKYGGLTVLTRKDGTATAYFCIRIDVEVDGQTLREAVFHVARSAEEASRSLRTTQKRPVDDDDDNGAASKIVGTWKLTDSKGACILLTIRPQGTYTMAFFGPDGEPGVSFRGRCVTGDNGMVRLVPDEDSGDRRRWIVKQVEARRLVLGLANDSDMNLPFVRVR